MQVYCTGHSLGGAVASLAAFDIARELNISPQRIKLYTFGCPRLGNRAFVDEFNKVCCAATMLAHMHVEQLIVCAFVDWL
jgi:predicted lipase